MLLADDVRNTGETFERAKAAIEEAGGTVIATAADLRSAGSHRGSRRAELRAGRVPRAGESSRRELSAVQGRHARHQVLTGTSSRQPPAPSLAGVPTPRSAPAGARCARLQAALDRLYASFDHPESALDPIQIVRRYRRVDDREIVAFVAAGLAFGRVASVMASVEAVCARAWAVARRRSCARSIRPATAAASCGLVHRWTRGAISRGCSGSCSDSSTRHGSLERAFARGLDPARADVEAALEAFSARARAVDLRPDLRPCAARIPARTTFSAARRRGRPASGSICSCAG